MPASRIERRRDAWRWSIWIGTAAALLGIVGAIVWFVGVPRYRPGLRPGEVYGIDVSRHQGAIDWETVARQHIAAAYVKATEGGDLVDDRFVRNWHDANAAGLHVGAYHFFTFCRPGAAQAANVIRTVPKGGALPLAVDLEFGGNCAARPSEAEFRLELERFLSVVEERYGQRAVLYVEPALAVRYRFIDSLSRRRWIPSSFRRPHDSWSVWQVSAFAKVRGVNGNVDLDVFRIGELSARSE